MSEGEMNGRDGRDGRDNARPIPDPTTLTTQALERENDHVKELMHLGDKHVQEMMELRNTSALSLAEERQKRADLQFALVERQRVEQKKDTKDAVDAALTAQKEAVKEQTTASDRAIAKSENSTNNQLAQLATTFTTAVDALRRSIDEVKERVTDVDKKTSAVVDQKIGAKDDRTGLYAAVAVIATILLAVLGLVGFIASG